MHMQSAASRHTAAIASGLLKQKRCGEPDAGPYCIAKPSGFGRIAEFVGWILSFFYGGYQSIMAIETPGGDDDQQWLTFWVIFVGSMSFEHAFARVLLSKFPLYYQFKLVAITWLIFFDGANYLYRKFRRSISEWSPNFVDALDDFNHKNAQNQLDSMVQIGGKVVSDKIALLESNLKSNPAQRNCFLYTKSSKVTPWEYDYTDTKRGVNRISLTAEDD